MTFPIREKIKPIIFIISLCALALPALLLESGCAKISRPRFTPGQDTESELKRKLGPPDYVAQSKANPKAKLEGYLADGCIYQFDKGDPTLSSYSCPPQPGEVTLQYWRHQWRGHRPVFEELKANRDPHGSRMFKLVSPKAHMAVIYDESKDRVTEVVEYGAR
jgi:hypothetical protein